MKEKGFMVGYRADERGCKNVGVCPGSVSGRKKCLQYPVQFFLYSSGMLSQEFHHIFVGLVWAVTWLLGSSNVRRNAALNHGNPESGQDEYEGISRLFVVR